VPYFRRAEGKTSAENLSHSPPKPWGFVAGKTGTQLRLNSVHIKGGDTPFDGTAPPAAVGGLSLVEKGDHKGVASNQRFLSPFKHFGEHTPPFSYQTPVSRLPTRQ